MELPRENENIVHLRDDLDEMRARWRLAIVLALLGIAIVATLVISWVANMEITERIGG